MSRTGKLAVRWPSPRLKTYLKVTSSGKAARSHISDPLARPQCLSCQRVYVELLLHLVKQQSFALSCLLASKSACAAAVAFCRVRTCEERDS